VNVSIISSRNVKESPSGPGFPVMGFKYPIRMISISSGDCYAVSSGSVLQNGSDLTRDFELFLIYSD